MSCRCVQRRLRVHSHRRLDVNLLLRNGLYCTKWAHSRLTWTIAWTVGWMVRKWALRPFVFCNFLLVNAIVRVTNGRREWNQMQISIGFCPRRAVWMNPCINAFIIVFSVYDSGTCFSPAILDITDDDLRAKFMEVGTKHTSVVLHFVRNVLLCETWKNRKTDLTDETMMFESRCVKWW